MCVMTSMSNEMNEKNKMMQLRRNAYQAQLLLILSLCGDACMIQQTSFKKIIYQGN
jgi:hypothetical protein